MELAEAYIRAAMAHEIPLKDEIAGFVKHVKGRKLCLHAGGAIGRYPRELAQHFEQVVTLEPNQQNWPELHEAIDDLKNVKVMHAAFWDSVGSCNMTPFRTGKALTAFVKPGGEVPLIMMDSLDLTPDLIWLDIEGSEFRALTGGAKTVSRCNAIIIEVTRKGCEQNVGNMPGQAHHLLLSLGFREVHKYMYDHLYLRDG